MHTIQVFASVPWNPTDKKIRKIVPITFEFQQMGTTTICLAKWKSVLLGVGAALLNPNDTFNDKTGFKTAFNSVLPTVSHALYLHIYKPKAKRARWKIEEVYGYGKIHISIGKQLRAGVIHSINAHFRIETLSDLDLELPA